jgi:hypothetical protein
MELSTILNPIETWSDNNSTHFEHGVPLETSPNSRTSSMNNRTCQRREPPTESKKTEAERRRRLELTQSLSRLQNSLLQVNPDLPIKDSWRRLNSNNISNVGKTTEGDPLSFNKTDVIDSAARLLTQFDAMFTAIITKRQHLQRVYYQSMSHGALQEQLSYLLFESLLNPDFIEDMVKCRKLIGSNF